jgi:hypothetical protein
MTTRVNQRHFTTDVSNHWLNPTVKSHVGLAGALGVRIGNNDPLLHSFTVDYFDPLSPD